MAGVPSVFVRLPGCSLRCKWCDTKYAWETTAGVHYNVEKIIQTVQQAQTDFVVITGGEPMINEELPELVRKLKTAKKHITIETAGIAFIPDMPCDLMSISPKLSNSVPDEPEFAAVQENARLDIAILGEMIDNYNYQLKFVVDSEDDLDEITTTDVQTTITSEEENNHVYGNLDFYGDVVEGIIHSVSDCLLKQ